MRVFVNTFVIQCFMPPGSTHNNLYNKVIIIINITSGFNYNDCDNIT